MTVGANSKSRDGGMFGGGDDPHRVGVAIRRNEVKIFADGGEFLAVTRQPVSDPPGDDSNQKVEITLEARSHVFTVMQFQSEPVAPPRKAKSK